MTDQQREFVMDDDFTYQHLDALTTDDLRRLGAHLLGYVMATRALGHAKPSEADMYIAVGEDPMAQLVRDIMLNCMFAPDKGAVARIDRFFENIGALDLVAEAAAVD